MGIKAVSILICGLTLLNSAAFSQTQINLNKETSGLYRICGSEEGMRAVQQKEIETIQSNNVSLFEKFDQPSCYGGFVKIIPIEKAPEIRENIGWNYVYDPTSNEEPFDLTIDGKKVSITCRTVKQQATYYYAYYTAPSGVTKIVYAQIFPTQLVTQYLDAQRRLNRRPGD